MLPASTQTGRVLSARAAVQKPLPVLCPCTLPALPDPRSPLCAARAQFLGMAGTAAAQEQLLQEGRVTAERAVPVLAWCA